MSIKTIQDINRKNCTGCMMCGDLCAKNAISFKMINGFWYPVIDNDKCVNCGLCITKCPSTKVYKDKSTEPIVCYGVKSKNNAIRFESTSGGVFSELAQKWMENGGICIGAIYDSDCNIVHADKKTLDGIAALRQSKYAQSRTESIYKTVKKYLNKNIKVMFCGTACQVEALYSFLGEDSKNLITIDFVCCGICSPVVYRKYLESLERKYRSKIKKVWFKNKEHGWRSIAVRIDFENGKKYLRNGNRDAFMTCFVTDGLSIRDCCYVCQYRKTPHKSDFTLADFWGIEKISPDFDDNNGVSAVMINTKKGKLLFNQILDRIDYFETTVYNISANNFTVYKSKEINKNREEFLKAINEMPFDKAIKKYSSYSGINKIKADLQFYNQTIRNCLTGRK